MPAIGSMHTTIKLFYKIVCLLSNAATYIKVILLSYMFITVENKYSQIYINYIASKGFHKSITLSIFYSFNGEIFHALSSFLHS